MAALEDCVQPGDKLLDMGTGSGILAIAAAMLGAEVQTVVDIDENCLKTAQENAEKNHVSIGRGLCGDALRDEKLARGHRRRDMISSSPILSRTSSSAWRRCSWTSWSPAGTLICSGILNERADEVRAALEAQGFVISDHANSEDWSAFTAKK